MSYAFPTVSQFKGNFRRDFPYAVPAFGGAGLAILSGGSVGSIAVSCGGTGYTEPPTVSLQNQPGDTTGSGAVAVAVVENGAVTAFTISAAGSGYILPPLVDLSGGAGDDSNLEKVTDWDIQGGIEDASFNVNPGLFADQAQFQRAFLYYAAHQMVSKLQASAAGVQSQYEWLTTSKTVGDVSQSFAVPKELLEDTPWLADMSKTRYGALYLNIVGPLLIGNVGFLPTVTNP